MGTTTRAQAARSAEANESSTAPAAGPPTFFTQLWAAVTGERSAGSSVVAAPPASSLPIEVLDLTDDDATPAGSTALPQAVDLTGESDGEGGTEGRQAGNVPAPRLGEMRSTGYQAKRAAREPGKWWDEEESGSRSSSLRSSTIAKRQKREAAVAEKAARRAKEQREGAQYANVLPVTVLPTPNNNKETAVSVVRGASLGLAKGKQLAILTAELRKRKLEKRRKDRSMKQQRWDNAENIMQSLRSRLPNSIEVAAFEQALEHRVQLLKSKDEQNGKKLVRKARSRLYRALQIVKHLPRFRQVPFQTVVENRKTSSRVATTDYTIASAPALVPPEPLQSATTSQQSQNVTTEQFGGDFESEQPGHGIVQAGEDDLGLRSMDVVEQLPLRPRLIVVKQESMLTNDTSSGHIRELRRAQDVIWKRHWDAMQCHFAARGLPKIVWTTKMAIQEKGFRNQAENELQVADAKEITEQQTGNGTQACITDFGGTFFDTEFAKDALWELSSTRLWQYYEGGNSWDQLGWIPGGYLRIQETRAAGKNYPPEASVILEFGNRAFTAERVPIPRCE